MRWYVIHAKDTIIAVDNLEAQGFSVYAPKLKIYKNKELKRVNMFGNYIFVELDLKVPGWQAVANTRGVRRILCMQAEKPSPLPVGLIEQFREVESLEPPVPETYAVGEKLKIIEGPLSGLQGICANSTSKRVAILLTLLGGENMIYISSDAVQRA